MKYKIIELIVMSLILSCKTTSLTTNNSSKIVSLFNGTNLSGWRVSGKGKWYVENGELVCESETDKAFGYLSTNKHYKNFELSLEFKQEINGNSGVFIRSIIKGTNISGWQVEIGPPGHNTGGVHEYDRGWLVNPVRKNDKILKEGEWNHMKIRLEGDKLISWLNGTQMVTITDKKIGAGEGSIVLQLHNDKINKIRWRNLQLMEL